MTAPTPCVYTPGIFGGFCVHTWAVPVTVSLSTRLPPDVRERLVSVAGEQGVAPGTLARDLITAGLDGGAPERGDGAVCNEVECLFHGLPPEAGLRKEVCLALARTVEAGGRAGIAAARELVYMTNIVRSLYEPD